MILVKTTIDNTMNNSRIQIIYYSLTLITPYINYKESFHIARVDFKQIFHQYPQEKQGRTQ